MEQKGPGRWFGENKQGRGRGAPDLSLATLVSCASQCAAEPPSRAVPQEGAERFMLAPGFRERSFLGGATGGDNNPGKDRFKVCEKMSILIRENWSLLN